MWMHSWEWPGAHLPWVWYAIGHSLWWLIMIVVLAALIVWVRRVAGRPDRCGPTARAMEVLAERYARGEITQDEFEQRRRVLRG